ncbi:MAG: response regulator [Gemmatimonadota bacterium]|nr:MAG: response regulator [Gemmatimonadota bacterium]
MSISPSNAADYRVLIVDDEPVVLDAVSDYLTAYGFQVDVAQELGEAEALLSSSDYSLVIADVRLTGIHGREGLELLRSARRQSPGAKTIVITAHGADDLEREARRRGADTFLEKPIPLSDLLLEVRRLLMEGDEAAGRRTLSA